MNRALPILLLVTALVGGVGFLALRTADEPGHTGDAALRRATDGELGVDPDAAIELAPVDEAAIATQAGVARRWDIIPMNLVGQVVRDARITATSEGEERTATGRVRWTDAEAVSWDVVIESDDFPTWRRSVLLGAGQIARTVAYLDDEIRIDGTVVDTFGAPVAGTMLHFLPRGELHPTQQFAEQNESLPPAIARRESGIVPVTTDASGKFRTMIPSPGDWRISVGPPSAARWTQRESSELSHGGPNFVMATIPALAQIRFECPDQGAERPVRVRAYRFDAEVARRAEQEGEARAAKAIAPAATSDSGSDSKNANSGERSDEDRDSDSSVARARANDGRSGYDRPSGQPLEPGWVLIGQAAVNNAGGAVLEDMPGDVDLRFLFLRGGERIVTGGSYQLRKAKRSLARVTLPAAGSVQIGTVDERASLRIGPDDADGLVEQEPGVVWTY